MKRKLASQTECDFSSILTLPGGDAASGKIDFIGDTCLLQSKKVGIICSVRCPGLVVLKTFDAVRDLRDTRLTIIGGFHSPMERECFGLFMRRVTPLIVCPARSIVNMRIPAEWKTPLEEGKLLIISPFRPPNHRVTTALATIRNEFVAYLADAIFIPYASPGSKTENLIRQCIGQAKQVYAVDDSENSHLFSLGVRPLDVAALSKVLKV